MSHPESQAPTQRGTNEWESEGGATAVAGPDTIPAGVEAITVTYYRVGDYTYSTLADAMAQYRRTLPASS